MKKIIILPITLLLINSQYTFSQVKAKIVFKDNTHNYGTIKEEDGPVKCTFYFTNEGDASLYIMDVQPGCGCTAADWTKDTIPPKGEGFVEAVFNPANRPGPFTKAITVLSNDPDYPRTVLIIKGDVTPRPKTIIDFYPAEIGNLRLTSNHIAFMDILSQERKTDTLKIYNNWNKSIKLTFSDVPVFLETKAEPVKLSPKEEGLIIVTYDAVKKNDWGLNFDKFNLLTNDDLQAVKVINVSAIIKEDFSKMSEKELEKAPKVIIENDRFNFGQIKQGEQPSFTFILKNEGKNDLIIRKIKPSCGCTAVTPEKITLKNGESNNIKVVFNTQGLFGAQHKTVTVITNDPKNPETTLHIQGSVIR